MKILKINLLIIKSLLEYFGILVIEKKSNLYQNVCFNVLFLTVPTLFGIGY